MKYLYSLLAAVALAGCSSNPYKPVPYDPEDSLALNVVQTYGIRKLQDQEVPKDQATGDSAALAATLGASGYFSGVSPLSPGMTAGLNVASIVFSPKDPAASTTFIVWMPKELAADETGAANALMDIFDTAIEKAAKEMEIALVAKAPWDKNVMRYSIDAAFSGGARCSISYAAAARGMPTLREVPQFVPGHTSPQSWLFYRPGVTLACAKTADKKKVYPPEFPFLERLSAHLPEWVYIYVAPKDAYVGEGTQVFVIPVVLHKGQRHYFLKPGSAS